MDYSTALIVIVLLITAGVAEWDVCKAKRKQGRLPEDIQ